MELAGFTDLVRLYEGGQAVVYRARRVADDTPVVLKMLRGPYPSPASLAGFRREYDLTNRLAGEGVVGVESWGERDGLPMIVLEDFGAESLERSWSGGVPELAEAVELALAMVKALGRIHANRVLHLDLNPSNVVRSPETRELKIIDFGLSTDLPRQSASLNAGTIVGGTFRFASPEQTGRMNRSVDYRSDYYSLGGTLYWLFTGRPPFVEADPLALVHAHIARRPAPIEDVPAPLSQVVLKLLEKNAEDRYQSIFGILADLEMCAEIVAGLESEFVVGAADRASTFCIPERLYGRAEQLGVLQEGFGRVAAGAREVMWVSGQPGMGKTALVREVERTFAGKRSGLFSGKFEQFKQGVPYAGLATPFRQFVRQVLTGSESEIDRWRARIDVALAPNQGLMVELIPELELVLGEQPPASSLPELEAEGRLHRTVRRFMRLLATAEHPLVLFLDDLQWADMPSIALLKVLATDPENRHVLIIGAYRDNEVGPGHPLRGLFAELEANGVPENTVHVEELNESDVTQLLSETLTLPADDVRSLAHWSLEKTAGNPFFLHRFLEMLVSAELLRFSTKSSTWRWDLEGIRALEVTDNVVDFLASRLDLLSQDAQAQLEAAAIIGGSFAARDLALCTGRLLEDVILGLESPLREGLIEELPSGTDRRFGFRHDRIQQAAYERSSDAVKAKLHQRFGERLLEETDNPESSDVLFEIVNHLNAGSHTPDAAKRLSRLNVEAGRRAQIASAHEPAARYFEQALALLGTNGWVDAPDPMREATEFAARAACTLTNYDRMDDLLVDALAHARDHNDRVRTMRIRINALIMLNRTEDAVSLGLDALRLLGIELPLAPEEADIAAGLGATFERLKGVDLDTIPDRPEPADAATRLSMEILCALAPPAYFVNQALLPLLGVELVRLTLERGPTSESSYGFSLLGLVLCDVGHIDQGYAFGQVSWALAAKFDDKRMRVRSGHVYFGFVRHWKESVVDYLPEYHGLFELAVDIGDFEYAAFAGMMVTIHAFYLAPNLEALVPSAKLYADTMVETGQVNGFAIHGMLYQAILNLVEGSDDPVLLTGEIFDEPSMLAIFRELNDPTALFVFHCVKCVLAGLQSQWERALALADEARAYIHGGTATSHKVILEQWDALICATLALDATDDEAERLLVRAESRLVLLDLWAGHNPTLHGHRPGLVRGAIARGRGQRYDALEALESAARQARLNGRTADEGVALKLAGELCIKAELFTAGRAYLIESFYAFERWGGQSVADSMLKAYPAILGNLSANAVGVGSSVSMSSAAAVNLDITTVIRASQAVAKEIELGRLVETVVRLSMEAGGATRAVVVTADGPLRITATGFSDPEPVVELADIPLSGSTLVPEGIIRYAARTREEVLLSDAGSSELAASDPYVVANSVKSLLCLPVEHQGQLKAVLYLEHREGVGVFTMRRIALLRILLGQAAISVENATLVSTLEEKVRARTEQLASANEAKSIFLRSMSHELRTPLNAILGYAALLLDEHNLSEEPRDAAQTIQRSGRHLLSLINDILDMHKVEAGKLELVLGSVRLDELVGGMVKMFRPEVEKKGLLLESTIDADLPDCIVGDVRRLNQVLLNLLGNAVKFTSSGQVTVVADKVGDDRLRITVQDTGPGISEANVNRIFEAFEQSGEALDRSIGTGLGLAIARRLALLMEGDITVETVLGEGSSFALTMPLVVCNEAELRKPSTPKVLVESRPVEPIGVVPDKAQLEALLQLLGEGALSDIRRICLEHAEQDPSVAPFLTRLAELARDFDEDGVEALLRQGFDHNPEAHSD